MFNIEGVKIKQHIYLNVKAEVLWTADWQRNTENNPQIISYKANILK